jgi:hypothetical protein
LRHDPLGELHEMVLDRALGRPYAPARTSRRPSRRTVTANRSSATSARTDPRCSNTGSVAEEIVGPVSAIRQSFWSRPPSHASFTK